MANWHGKKLGKYHILERIGRGGMGEVYKAIREDGEFEVAIKILKDDFVQDEHNQNHKRFERELKLALKLQHHHIVPVYDYDMQGEPYYIVMRLLERSLQEALEKDVLTTMQRLKIIQQAAEALGFAHQNGVIHRDVKPLNILLDKHGTAFLADFGIARLLEATTHLTGTQQPGTAAYMSPEQCRGDKDIDHRSDIYSFGIMVYQLLTGQLPFVSSTVAGFYVKHLTELHEPPSFIIPQLPLGIDAVFNRVLEKDRQKRYASVQAFYEALYEVFSPSSTLGDVKIQIRLDESSDSTEPQNFPEIAFSAPIPIVEIEKEGTHEDVPFYGKPEIWRHNLTDEQRKLIAIIENPNIPPPERAEAGRKLGEIGDPRPGVGVWPNGLPDMNWVAIPAGEFLMGSDKKKDPLAYDNETPMQKLDLPMYYMARYPVTYAQYALFVQGDGYKNKDYWTDAGWKWKSNRTQPELWGDKQWHIVNHPVVGVTWYEAMAYAAWFNTRIGQQQSGYIVRLPTEAEWEKAARGTDGRIFPWGDTYVSGYANIQETYSDRKVGEYYLQRTSAVGIYPMNQSPFGIFDTSGNVWEWCLNKWQDKYKHDSVININNSNSRALRGGSWSLTVRDGRCAFRSWYYPLTWLNNWGLRLCFGASSIS